MNHNSLLTTSGTCADLHILRLYIKHIVRSEVSPQLSPQQKPLRGRWDPVPSHNWDKLLRDGPEDFQSTAAASKLCLEAKYCGTLSL